MQNKNLSESVDNENPADFVTQKYPGVIFEKGMVFCDGVLVADLFNEEDLLVKALFYLWKAFPGSYDTRLTEEEAPEQIRRTLANKNPVWDEELPAALLTLWCWLRDMGPTELERASIID
jgi:hypothetical protein